VTAGVHEFSKNPGAT